MPNKQPPKDKQFPVNRPYAPHAGFKGPYLTPLLRKVLNKSYTLTDPDTQKINKLKGKDAVMIQLVRTALKGDVAAIKEILDRIDGKVIQKIENEITVKEMGRVKINGKPLETDIG
ncbi:MAG: DUF5681 domain-containing protein [Candidatus Omnitrophota bacterium]|jgi:hypothetical protein